MASEIIELEQGVWTQVTDADKDGSIYHRDGRSIVVYLEASAPPTGLGGNTPVMETTQKGQSFPYYGVAAGDNIYALAVTDNAKLVKSPKGA